MQIRDAATLYQTQLEADGRALATRMQYARHVRARQGWLEAEERSCEIDALDHETLAQFLTSPAARRTPAGTAKRATSTNALRSSLRCFFAYLHASGIAGQNPARLVRRARCSPPPPRALNDVERQRLLDVLAAASGPEAERDRALFGLMLFAGTRLSATLGLRVEDVDLERAELQVRRDKNDRADVVLLGPDAVELLRGYLASRGQGWLFPGRAGEPLVKRQAQRRFRIWAERAGLGAGVSPHALRHTFATRLLGRTGDLALVQRALGHPASRRRRSTCACSTSGCARRYGRSRTIERTLHVPPGA